MISDYFALTHVDLFAPRSICFFIDIVGARFIVTDQIPGSVRVKSAGEEMSIESVFVIDPIAVIVFFVFTDAEELVIRQSPEFNRGNEIEADAVLVIIIDIVRIEILNDDVLFL